MLSSTWGGSNSIYMPHNWSLYRLRGVSPPWRPQLCQLIHPSSSFTPCQHQMGEPSSPTASSSAMTACMCVVVPSRPRLHFDAPRSSCMCELSAYVVYLYLRLVSLLQVPIHPLPEWCSHPCLGFTSGCLPSISRPSKTRRDAQYA